MPSGHDAAPEATPYFFLSYAHRAGAAPGDEYRRNLLIHRFRADLGQAVQRCAREGADAADAEGAEDDDDWSEHVAPALASCGAFVALYSDEYFSSEHCGKEWGVFADRLEADRGERGSRTEAIIPVLWQPVAEDALPDCARDVQPPPDDLGAAYGRYGLNYLLRHLPECHGEYEEILLRLARRITEVAERRAPKRTESSVGYPELKDAFQRPGDRAWRHPRMRILIAALTRKRLYGADPEMYGDQPTDWKPFVPRDHRTVAELVRPLIESMGFRGPVEALDRDTELGGDATSAAPTLLVIDAWAMQDESLRERLRDFDSRADRTWWIRPVVLLNRANPVSGLRAPELEARLTATLERCRSRYRSAAPRVLDGLGTARDLVSELPDVIRDLERRYFAELSPNRPEPGAARRPRFRIPDPERRR
ncbi:MAG TPA: TIR-like protein FxsC [Actinospica sp.]|jgi:FxsC-like protein|nr:TIR-like protein FxsC [Actinospica sp.]